MQTFVMPKHLDHFIGGSWQPSKNRETFTNYSPHDSAPLGEVALGSKLDVEIAVRAAEEALSGPWGKTTWAERAAMVRELGDLIQSNLQNMAALEAIDTGKPFLETSTGDVPRAASNLHFYAGLEENILERLWTSTDGSKHKTVAERIGVVGLITPWNFPLHLLTWKLGPALMTGNTVVFKPAELTPLSATFLCELIEKSSLPKGVVNMVHGFGPDSAGQALVEHPGVKAISFTGETLTGQAIMRSAAPWLKKLSFELGGKGASLIFADADLKSAAAVAERAAFRNQGQVCLAGSRLIVERKVGEQVLERLLGCMRELKMGHPLDEKTTFGSLISQDHRDKVRGYIEYAQKTKDGRVMTGGNVPKGFERGAYLEPTVIADVPQGSKLVQEEIFGPVLTVQYFDTFEEGLTMLNGTKYGLSCSIWSSDKEKLDRASSLARTGMVWQNQWNLRNLNSAFGGMKHSGVGREGGEYSLEFFSELKTIVTPAG